MTSLQRRVSNCNSIPSDIQPRGNEKKCKTCENSKQIRSSGFVRELLFIVASQTRSIVGIVIQFRVSGPCAEILSNWNIKKRRTNV